MRRRSRLLSCPVETKRNFSLETWNEDKITLTGIEIETLQDGGFICDNKNSWINWN